MVTNVSVKNALSVLKDDRGGFFEPVQHINIDSYRYQKQLDKRISNLRKNTKKENYKIKTLRNNYKTAIEEQIKGGNITKKQGKQLLKYMKSLPDNDLIKWFYRERKAVSVFNYIDTSREYTKNQMLVNEQLSKGIKHDLSDVTDSLAVASGNAYVSGGVVKYRK